MGPAVLGLSLPVSPSLPCPEEHRPGLGGVTAQWGQRVAVHVPCMPLAAEPQQLPRCLAPLCCPDPSPGAGFQSHSAGLSQAGSDRGSAKVCRAGAGGGLGVLGGLGALRRLSGTGSQTCWDLAWAGGHPPNRGICTRMPLLPAAGTPPHPLLVFSCLVKCMWPAQAVPEPLAAPAPAPAPPGSPPLRWHGGSRGWPGAVGGQAVGW